ncbi:MAG: ribonuclease HI family protein [Synergistales bacterium]|nr:ribonuclease HI family protein [Synergistales bacterium]
MIRGYFDGGSRGNPGVAGAGALLVDEQGRAVWQASRFLGRKTNNEAEYAAVLLLLEELQRRGAEGGITLYGDSRLVVNQLQGTWKVREPRLQPLHARARDLLRHTGARVAWVPRKDNSRADALANRAMDGGPDAQGGDSAEAASPLVFRKVAAEIFVVSDGDERFAVDRRHAACTCPAFRKEGSCRHLEEAKSRP